MFDFIEPERRSFWKKVVGIGTLSGVLIEAIKQLKEKEPGTASVFAFCSLFVFLWLVDVFKEGASEVIEAVDHAEATAFSSKKTFSVDLPASPSDDVVKKLREQIRQILSERFPPGRGSEVIEYDDPKSLFKAEVRRSSLCACEISARLKTYSGITHSRSLTEESNPFIGTLDLAIERRSSLRNVVTTSAVLLSAIAGLLGLVGLQEAAGVPILFTIVLWIASVPIWILAWDKTATWFPGTLLTALYSDIIAILGENGFLESAPDAPAIAGARPPFWTIEVPKRRGWKFYLGCGLLVAIGGLLLWRYTRPKTLEEGLTELHGGNYRKAQGILLPIARTGNVVAREELEKYAFGMNSLDDWYVLGSLADMGYAPAQFDVAFHSDSGTEEDAVLMKKASDQGFSDAQAVMGTWYMEGRGVAVNPQEGNRLWALSAAKGDKYAQWSLYDLAIKQRNYQRAYYWLRICEEESPHPTRNILARCPDNPGERKSRLSPSERAAVENDVRLFLESNGLQTR